MTLYKKTNEIQKKKNLFTLHILILSLFLKSQVTFTHIYKYQTAYFIFLHMQNVAPVPLSSPFNLSGDYHHYSTRQRDNLHNIQSLKYSYSIRFQGPQIWNSISLSLNTSLSRSNYKVNTKIRLCLLISQPSFFSYYVVSFLLRMSTITLST